ncbi:MAG: glucodextranase DOMON-like domain-containing protein [bacterium]
MKPAILKRFSILGAILGFPLMLGASPGWIFGLTLIDPIGDDYGPGTYNYPLDRVFTPGSFDITKVTINNIGNQVRFEIEIQGEIEDPWNSGQGFSLQSIDIYIDEDGVDGSGATWSLERRNVKFSGSSAWEFVIWCAPPFDDFRTHVMDSEGRTYFEGITVSVDRYRDIIRIDVPQSIIGAYQEDWYITVLMLGQNGYEPGRVRPVMKNRGQWVFGGGDDGQADANVIDMATSGGVNQEALLANYNPTTKVQPILINRVDNSVPQIVHLPPSSWEAHIPMEISTCIFDDVVTSASVYFRPPGSNYKKMDLTRFDDTTWVGRISGVEIVEPEIEYCLFATDATNSAFYPDSSSPFVVTIGSDVTPPHVDIEVDPPIFSPNGDGYRDTVSIAVRVSEPGWVWLWISDMDGGNVRDLAQAAYAESLFIVGWDANDNLGNPCEDGQYIVVAHAVDLAGHQSSQESLFVQIDRNQPARRLDVILLFHANQNLVPYGKVANLACYKGVLNTLRSHPALKFMIHFSGSLLSDLLWFDPETIEILREGIEDGQFEIVGSTYIQNIIYSTRSDPEDFQFNHNQIRIHKQQIIDILGVEPKSFWNPERVWTQSIVKLLTDNGYSAVQVEDHILWSSGISGSEYYVRTTNYDGKSVYVFNDDKAFEGLINGAIDSGDTASVIWFLRNLYQEDVNDGFAICYHEDMEATGLWDYESGENPSVDFANLNKLLTAFENNPWIKVTTYSEFLQLHEPFEDITPIVDGAADWMGRDAWFQENSHPQAEYYRYFFDSIRDSINLVHSLFPIYEPDTVASRKLIDHAWFTLCAHQYEFAVHGFQGMVGTTQWELARTALVSSYAAREALLRRTHSKRCDINLDGLDEIVISNGTDLFVLTPYGGRLLYWFDLEDGTELVGNENFMTSYGEVYSDDSRYVQSIAGCNAYPWLCGNTVFPEIHSWRFEARRRCFNDSIWVDSQPQGDLVNTCLSYSFSDSGVDFNYQLALLDVVKRVRTQKHRLSVEYEFISRVERSLKVDLMVENGLSPDCLRVVLGGRVLRYWDGIDTSSVFAPGMSGVLNIISDKGLLVEFTDTPATVTGEENVFGLEITPIWQLIVPPLGSGIVRTGLSVVYQSSVEPPVERRGGILILPNPSTGNVMIQIGKDLDGSFAIEIFDTAGRAIRTLSPVESGDGFVFIWDGRNSRGEQVASGIYFVKVPWDRGRESLPIVILR